MSKLINLYCKMQLAAVNEVNVMGTNKKSGKTSLHEDDIDKLPFRFHFVQ